MTDRAKWFLAGFLSAAVAGMACALTFDHLRVAMIQSKSKRLLAQSSYYNDKIGHYRSVHGFYPRTKQDMARDLGLADRELSETDYFAEGTGYTLIYPSSRGELRWEQYVFHNGELVAWPPYMDAVVQQSTHHAG